MRFPGTLSARIIIGFAVLVVTFGGISLSAVLTTDQLNSTIRVIRIGYLELALRSSDLLERQKSLLAYLKDELTGESRPQRVAVRVRRLREARDDELGNVEKALAGLRDIPQVHARDIRKTAEHVREIRVIIAETLPLYAPLVAAPPLDKLGGPARPPANGSAVGGAGGAASGAAAGGSAVDRALVAGAEAALTKLQARELRLNGLTQTLQRRQREAVQNTARNLEFGARKMRFLTILWGAIALLLGVLITIWATVNLRPLRRLRDAAREIARGDYGQRIEESGPREVADLAREFNTMGSAIQERERELVRTERLAAVGKMAAMITHEVRNPLSSIGLNAELLEEELVDLSGEHGEKTAEARALCRAIQAELDRLTAITEEYLYFARLPKPKVQEEALGPIIKSLIDFEREPMSARGVTLEVELADDLPPVMVDDAQVRQALLNLLRNAGDAVGEVGTGRVRVHTRRGAQPGTAEVVV